MAASVTLHDGVLTALAVRRSGPLHAHAQPRDVTAVAQLHAATGRRQLRHTSLELSTGRAQSGELSLRGGEPPGERQRYRRGKNCDRGAPQAALRVRRLAQPPETRARLPALLGEGAQLLEQR